MSNSLRERLKQTRIDYKREQKERKREEELKRFRKIKPKLSVRKPRKTGLILLNELFEAVIQDEESIYWATYYYRSNIDQEMSLFRATKSGVLAKFGPIPILGGIEKLEMAPPLDKTVVEEISNLWPKWEDEEFIKKYGDPRLFSGALTRALIVKEEKFGPEKILVARSEYQDRGHYLEGMYFKEYHLVSLDKLLDMASEVDKRFSYELSVGTYNTHYSLVTPLTEFTYPVADGWRIRDSSRCIKETHNYKLSGQPLRVGELSDKSDKFKLSERLDKAIQNKRPLLNKLFSYWNLLNKELEELNREYFIKQEIIKQETR